MEVKMAQTESGVVLPDLPAEVWAMIVRANTHADPDVKLRLCSFFFVCRTWFALTRYNVIWKALYTGLQQWEDAVIKSLGEQDGQSYYLAVKDILATEPSSDYRANHMFKGTYACTPNALRAPCIFQHSMDTYSSAAVINSALEPDWKKIIQVKKHCQQLNTQTVIKVVLLGNLGVGKTSLLMRFCADQFTQTPPVVFKNYTSRVYFRQHEIALSLWDTEMWDNSFDLEPRRLQKIRTDRTVETGGEDYTRMRIFTYPNTDVFLLCFSVTDRESFDAVTRRWIEDVNNYHRATPYSYVLCGTMNDKEARIVSHEEALQLAEEISAYAYIEVSAANGSGVDQLFEACIDSIFARSKHGLEKRGAGEGQNYWGEKVQLAKPYMGLDNFIQAPAMLRKAEAVNERVDWYPDIRRYLCQATAKPLVNAAFQGNLALQAE